MILKKLYLENIRSYEKQEIEFPLGSTLLSGDIGTGKTTILLAIEFALFGLQPSQKGSSLLRNNSEKGKVVFEFEVDSKNVVIERYLKKSKTITQDYASITIDNDKFEGSVSEVKAKVLKLLAYPPEFAKKTNLLYRFTVYTPQEEMKQIIIEPGETRLNTLRYVFGIDKYKRIEENVGIFASKLRERIRTNEGMFYDLDNEKKGVEERQANILELKEGQKNLAKQMQEAMDSRLAKEKNVEDILEGINEKKAFETEKSKSSILISEKKQQIASIQSAINTIENQLEESKKISFDEEKLKIIKEKIKFQEEKEQDMQKAYIQVISSINSNESRKRESEEVKKKISGLQKCPTCLQEVGKDYKEIIFRKMEEEIMLIQKTINELSRKKNQLIEQIEEVKKIKTELNKQKTEEELLKIKLENIKEKEERLEEMQKQQQSLKKDIEMLNKHIKSLDASIVEYEKYDLIYKQNMLELEAAKNLERNVAIKKAEVNKEIQLLEIQIKEKQEQIKKKLEIKEKTDKMREIEYWISERFLDFILFTEKQVMITLREEFSNLFSKWFSMLVSDSLSAKLDENFSPIIENQDYELEYSFLSGGERTAIALAYRLALNQVINSILSKIRTENLVILDEPTDGFSAQQLDKMRDVLNQLNTKQLIIVSHEQKMESFVDNIVRISKDFGSTKIDKKEDRDYSKKFINPLF